MVDGLCNAAATARKIAKILGALLDAMSKRPFILGVIRSLEETERSVSGEQIAQTSFLINLLSYETVYQYSVPDLIENRGPVPSRGDCG